MKRIIKQNKQTNKINAKQFSLLLAAKRKLALHRSLLYRTHQSLPRRETLRVILSGLVSSYCKIT